MNLFFSCTKRPVNQGVRQTTLNPANHPANQNLELVFMQMGIPPRDSSSSDESVESTVKVTSATKAKKAPRG
jgi:hypothetical protein